MSSESHQEGEKPGGVLVAGEHGQHTRLSVPTARRSRLTVRSIKTTLVSFVVKFSNGVILIMYMTDNPVDIAYKLLWNHPLTPTLVNELCKN